MVGVRGPRRPSAPLAATFGVVNNALKAYSTGVGGFAAPASHAAQTLPGPASPARGRQVLRRRKTKEEAPDRVDLSLYREKDEEAAALSRQVGVLKAQKKSVSRKLELLKAVHDDVTAEQATLVREVETLRSQTIGQVSLEEHLALREQLDSQEDKWCTAARSTEQASEGARMQLSLAEAKVVALEEKLAAQEAAAKEQVADLESTNTLLQGKLAKCRARAQMACATTQTQGTAAAAEPAALILRMEEASRRSLETAFMGVLVREASCAKGSMLHVESCFRSLEQTTESRVAGVNDCNALLQGQLAERTEQYQALQEASAKSSRDATLKWEELTQTKNQLLMKEMACKEMTAQVSDLTTKLIRSQQKGQTFNKVRTELRTSESERTRLHSENELLKEKLNVTKDLQDRLRQDAEELTDTMKQRNQLIASLETKVEELRKVSESKSKDLALIHDLKAQQQFITEETESRLTILHDAADYLISIVRAERQSIMKQEETGARDQQQTELIQLVNSQQQQLSIFNDRVEKMHAEHMQAVHRLEHTRSTPCHQPLSLASPQDNAIQDSSRYAPPLPKPNSMSSLRSIENGIAEEPGRSASITPSPPHEENITLPGSPDGVNGSISNRPLKLTEKSLADLAKETDDKDRQLFKQRRPPAPHAAVCAALLAAAAAAQHTALNTHRESNFSVFPDDDGVVADPNPAASNPRNTEAMLLLLEEDDEDFGTQLITACVHLQRMGKGMVERKALCQQRSPAEYSYTRLADNVVFSADGTEVPLLVGELEQDQDQDRASAASDTSGKPASLQDTHLIIDDIGDDEDVPDDDDNDAHFSVASDQEPPSDELTSPAAPILTHPEPVISMTAHPQAVEIQS